MSDPAAIDFGPCVCGAWPSRPEAATPGWATLSGWGDCLEWTEPGQTYARESPPVVGKTAPVVLRYPFQGRIGEPFWAQFDTAWASDNGLADRPELAARTCMVRARLVSVGSRRKKGLHEREAAEAVVEVLAVLTLDDLLARAPHAGEPLTGFMVTRYGFDHASAPDPRGELHVTATTHEGDDGETAVWLVGSDGAHLLLLNGWGAHGNATHAGHRLLTPEDVAKLCR